MRLGRERCDHEGHAVFLRPRIDSATMGSASTGISTSSTKLKMISTFCLRLPPQSAQYSSPENSPCRSAFAGRRLFLRSSCTLSFFHILRHTKHEDRLAGIGHGEGHRFPAVLRFFVDDLLDLVRHFLRSRCIACHNRFVSHSFPLFCNKQITPTPAIRNEKDTPYR